MAHMRQFGSVEIPQETFVQSLKKGMSRRLRAHLQRHESCVRIGTHPWVGSVRDGSFALFETDPQEC